MPPSFIETFAQAASSLSSLAQSWKISSRRPAEGPVTPFGFPDRLQLLGPILAVTLQTLNEDRLLHVVARSVGPKIIQRVTRKKGAVFEQMKVRIDDRPLRVDNLFLRQVEPLGSNHDCHDEVPSPTINSKHPVPASFRPECCHARNSRGGIRQNASLPKTAQERIHG